MAKVTAVEFIEISLLGIASFDSEKLRLRYKNIIEQAKQMEKEQSINDYCEGFKANAEGWNGEHGLKDMANIVKEIKAEEYYQEKYK